MNQIRKLLPLAFAYIFGAGALIGLLFVPALAKILTSWVGFLAGFALLIGILNLAAVHTRRLAKGNIYSAVLVVSLLSMIGLGVADYLGWTEDGVATAFHLVQVPLEAALASMLAFFLLFTGVRVIQKRRNWWGFLFIGFVIIFLLAKTPIPGTIGDVFQEVATILSSIFVNAGMRGLLIGVAIGTIAISIRVLMGIERPYEK